MGQALGKRRRRGRSYSFSEKDKQATGESGPVVSGTATLPPDTKKKDKKKRSVSSAAKFSSLLTGKVGGQGGLILTLLSFECMRTAVSFVETYLRSAHSIRCLSIYRLTQSISLLSALFSSF